jgi:hypothetical protein
MRWPPYDTRQNADKDYWNPYRGFPTQGLEDFFGVEKTMEDMKKILGEMLGDKDTKKRMKVMRKQTTLHAKVKRGEKVYTITIEEVTPKLSDIPDEIEIEWDDEGAFGEGHADLTE